MDQQAIDTPRLTFEQLSAAQYPLAKQLYKTARYSSKVSRQDSVYVVRLCGSVVAAARVVDIESHLVLRSMVVAPDNRRTGIGSFLLNKLTQQMNENACWCFPFYWLEGFYATSGFIRFDDEQAPEIIRQKYTQYLNQGRDILLTCRPSI